MELLLSKIVDLLLLPPMVFVLFGLLGLGISTMWRKQGVFVTMISLVGLLFCSLPIVSATLISTIQAKDALSEDDITKNLGKVDAIVVLAGGRRVQAKEFDDDTVSVYTLERLRYAAWLTKRTGLPLIASGGRIHNETKSESQLMQEVLQKEFIVIVDHIEEQSKSTYENAMFTAELLKEKKYNKIVLVTHAWHMRRAKSAFEHFDIEVVAGPTAFYSADPDLRLTDFFPSVKSLTYTYLAFHEMFGHWWYQVRYY